MINLGKYIKFTDKGENYMSEKIEYEELLDRLSESKSGLIDRYWDDYVKHKDLSFVVKPSIPIIWFGDLEAYCKSPVKVLTVAINPSSYEFPENGKPRFGESEKLANHRYLNGDEKKVLVKSYNKYFYTSENPYPKFFSAFERVLQNLPDFAVASYGDSENKPDKLYASKNNECEYHTPNCTAIHIDCKTALATEYLWKKSKKDIGSNYDEFQKVKKILSGSGEKLFVDFLTVLNPDVILVSSAEFRDKVLNKKGEKLNSIDLNNDEKNKYERISYKMDGRLWIYGRNNGGPFMLIEGKGDEEKKFLEKELLAVGI